MRKPYCDICGKEFNEITKHDWLNARMKDVFSVNDICKDCFEDFFAIVRKFRAEKAKSEGKKAK